LDLLEQAPRWQSSGNCQTVIAEAHDYRVGLFNEGSRHPPASTTAPIRFLVGVLGNVRNGFSQSVEQQMPPDLCSSCAFDPLAKLLGQHAPIPFVVNVTIEEWQERCVDHLA
jgi:hypothetical protein